MPPDWFKPRHYGHLDSPVSGDYADGIDVASTRAHAWSPHIKYIKKEKRYKRIAGQTVVKERPIMFASHRDACILSKYNNELCQTLDAKYDELGISECVAAYRSLGKSNYHFAKEVQDFVCAHGNVCVLCFDVHGFFDHLDHGQLKAGLSEILQEDGLPEDWYKVFRHVTKYRFVNLEDIKSFPDLKARLRDRTHPVATIKEIKSLGVSIHQNPNNFGIPQGTPISASFSNLYMLPFDASVSAKILEIGGFYRRYSDDILVACAPERMHEVEAFVTSQISALHLQLQTSKTERLILNPNSTRDFQYLGFLLGRSDAKIRHKSLSKQWRSIRRAVRNARKVGEKAIASGKSDKIFRRKVIVRYTEAGRRNFLSYAANAANELQSAAIRRQVKRLRKYAQKQIHSLK